jgi:hypothetical protein
MAPPPSGPGAFIRPVLSLLSFILVFALVLGITALVRDEGIHFGIVRIDPTMVATFLLVGLVFHIVTAPMRAARHASAHGWGYRSGWSATIQGLFGTLMALFWLWLLLSHMPPVHDFGDLVQGLPEAIRGAAREVAGWIREVADAIRDTSRS